MNATIDWASSTGKPACQSRHLGRREIAEFLRSNGARVDLFAAAMLGRTEAVKALIAAQPGIESTLGPHGIPMLSHARAGGAKAKDTLAGIPTQTMDNERRKAFTGVYTAEGGRKIEVKLSSPACCRWRWGAMHVGSITPVGRISIRPVRRRCG